MIHIFESDDSKSTSNGLGKAEFNGACGRDGGFNFLHPIDLFEFALGLGGFAGFSAETVSELLEGGNLLLLVFEGGEMLGFSGGFFDHVLVVVSR